jgi:hypothetical protein
MSKRDQIIDRLVADGLTPDDSSINETVTRIEVRETQLSISQWANKEFGEATALHKALRMNVEMTELLNDLGATVADAQLQHLLKANTELGEALCARVVELEQRRLVPHAQPAQGKECPDILVMLYQVAEATGQGLLRTTDAKMRINRKRKWGRLASGRHQHT